MRTFLIAVALVVTLPTYAQFSERQPDTVLSSGTKATLIDSLISKINNGYVFPDKTGLLEKALRNLKKTTTFKANTSSITFTEQVNQVLMQVSNDKHLQLLYSYDPVPQRDNKEAPLPEFITRFAVEHNYGFVKQEILDGNIGYINILGFFPFEEARTAATSAFRFVENTAALIVDLRQNNGGESNTANFVISYFFEEKPVNFLSTQFREGGRVEQSWSAANLPGKRYLGRPVFVLTGNQTFSAGEAMAFILQSLKKATIVGEVTGGGANVCDLTRLNEHFMINLPVGRPAVPGTKNNWDGVGVMPDIKASSDSALAVAVAEVKKVLSDSSRPVFVPHQLRQIQQN